MEIPDFRFQIGNSEAEAQESVRRSHAELKESAKPVAVDVPAPAGNPWSEFAARFADDPTYEEYIEAIRQARAEADGRDSAGA